MTENKLESFVKGSVIKQTFEIISGKREHYNFYRILGAARKIYQKHDELKFERVVQYYYGKEKTLFQKKLSRIKHNKNVQELSIKYPLTDIVKLTYYLTLNGKMTIQKKTDFVFLENIIKINLSLPIFDNTKSLDDDNDDLTSYLEQKKTAKEIMNQIKENRRNI